MEYFEALGRQLYDAETAPPENPAAPVTPPPPEPDNTADIKEHVMCSLLDVQTRDSEWLKESLNDLNRQRGIDRQKVKQRVVTPRLTNHSLRSTQGQPTHASCEPKAATHRTTSRSDNASRVTLPHLTTEFITAKWDNERT